MSSDPKKPDPDWIVRNAPQVIRGLLANPVAMKGLKQAFTDKQRASSPAFRLSLMADQLLNMSWYLAYSENANENSGGQSSTSSSTDSDVHAVLMSGPGQIFS